MLLIESLRSCSVHNFLHFSLFKRHGLWLLDLILRCVVLIACHHIHLCSRLLQFFLYCCLLLDERQRHSLNLIRPVTTPAQVVAPAIFVLVEVGHSDGTIGHPVDALTIVSWLLCICIDRCLQCRGTLHEFVNPHITLNFVSLSDCFDHFHSVRWWCDQSSGHTSRSWLASGPFVHRHPRIALLSLIDFERFAFVDNICYDSHWPHICSLLVTQAQSNRLPQVFVLLS